MPDVSTTEELVSEIKSKGYWTVSFTPLTYNQNAISTLPECKAILTSSAVHLRGWPYPATKHLESYEPVSIDDHVETKINWDVYKEIGRLYQSEKFVHLFTVHEDWRDIDKLGGYYWIPEGESIILSTVSTVYLFTEIFEFLTALAKSGLYKDGVDIEIGLHNNSGRVLVVETGRGPLYQVYKCHSSNIILKRRLSEDQIDKDGRKIAIDLLIELFHKFNWDNSPRNVFEEDQRKLLSRQT